MLSARSVNPASHCLHLPLVGMRHASCVFCEARRNGAPQAEWRGTVHECVCPGFRVATDLFAAAFVSWSHKAVPRISFEATEIVRLRADRTPIASRAIARMNRKSADASLRRITICGRWWKDASRSNAGIAAHLSAPPFREGGIAITARSACTRGMSTAVIPGTASASAGR